ncbi:hypothetical protein F511_19399 [Dorcoceras hygrometricum]|uniref:Uncharacterized protein n=1 Tax=Dorcoceras hygrometricum TaxID=472368 RepID=A0A2Z7D0J0_9LAMI|nr:hypothetical protein F511_19399 [Dorcoceras hygrometricum]
MAGDLPDGPHPCPFGPNLTDHGSNRARMKENNPLKDGARRCAETRSTRCSLLAYGSTKISHLWTTPSPPYDPLEPPKIEPRSLRQPLNPSHARRVQNREM